MWDSYRYTDPISEALTATFGTEFGLENTGGGCICIDAKLEGGYRLLVGCAVDGPLLRDSERGDFDYNGGYGVGIYDDHPDEEKWTGETLAHAVNYRAETAADVIDLVMRAMSLMQHGTDSHYLLWKRDAEGVETVEEWLK